MIGTATFEVFGACARIDAIRPERRAPMCGKIARITASARGPCTSACHIAECGAGRIDMRTLTPKSVAARPTTSRSVIASRTRG